MTEYLMPLAATPLSGFGHWVRSNLLEAVLLVTGAVLVTRFATWLSDGISERIGVREGKADALVRSETLKHRHAVTKVITWTFLVLIYGVTAVLTLKRLGLPLSGFVAPATVVGVALGFGAQRIVQDILAGFLIVTERQYGFGDVIRLTVLGAPNPVVGTVEDVTLRITRIRSVSGEVVITPNGQVVQVTNLSRDWARAVIDVPVPAGVELNRVTDILHNVCREVYGDPDLHRLLLDPPTVMGVESLEVSQFNVRVVARTLPGKQFDMGRALRARITLAFRREGIILPAALDTGESTRSG
jgi:small-conductance mechanosensitive channel